MNRTKLEWVTEDTTEGNIVEKVAYAGNIRYEVCMCRCSSGALEDITLYVCNTTNHTETECPNRFKSFASARRFAEELNAVMFGIE